MQATDDSLPRLAEAEVIHGRWAMMGVAGCLAVELFGFGDWFDAPLWAVEGANATYFGVPVPFDIKTLILLELVLMAGVEVLRNEEKDAGKRMYPGAASRSACCACCGAVPVSMGVLTLHSVGAAPGVGCCESERPGCYGGFLREAVRVGKAVYDAWGPCSVEFCAPRRGSVRVGWAKEAWGGGVNMAFCVVE